MIYFGSVTWDYNIPDRTDLIKYCIYDMLIQTPVLKDCEHPSSTSSGVRTTNHICGEVRY